MNYKKYIENGYVSRKYNILSKIPTYAEWATDIFKQGRGEISSLQNYGKNVLIINQQDLKDYIKNVKNLQKFLMLHLVKMIYES